MKLITALCKSCNLHLYTLRVFWCILKEIICKGSLLKHLLLKLPKVKHFVFGVVDGMISGQSLRSLFEKKFENRIYAKAVEQYAFVEKISGVIKFVEKISEIIEISGKQPGS